MWVGSSLLLTTSSFFSLSPSVYLLILFPEMQSSYRRIVVKGIGKSIHLLKKISLKARRGLFDKNERHSLSLSILQDSISTNE